jgi:HrpA-like RNA helicase
MITILFIFLLGCGKSTQVPQYLYHAGYDKIACTQPRRIACISLSKRVAHEMLCEYQPEVGYQIRFERTKTVHTHILFITEGLLLRQLGDDSNLSSYDVIILGKILFFSVFSKNFIKFSFKMRYTKGICTETF